LKLNGKCQIATSFCIVPNFQVFSARHQVKKERPTKALKATQPYSVEWSHIRKYYYMFEAIVNCQYIQQLGTSMQM